MRCEHNIKLNASNSHNKANCGIFKLCKYFKTPRLHGFLRPEKSNKLAAHVPKAIWLKFLVNLRIITVLVVGPRRGGGFILFKMQFVHSVEVVLTMEVKRS
jgi:hypothetical protein